MNWVRTLSRFFTLPCWFGLFAFLTFSLFKPQLEWKMDILNTEWKIDSHPIETTSIITTDIDQEPRLNLYCSRQSIAYIPTELMANKSSLERFIDQASCIVMMLFGITILNAAGNGLYLLIMRQFKVVFAEILWGGFACLILFAILTYIGPITSTDCFGMVSAEIHAKAELIKITMVGIPYLVIGLFLSLLSLFLVVVRYIYYRDWAFSKG